MMDTILAILGIAVSLGTLVPVFTPMSTKAKKVRFQVIGVVLATFLVGIFVYWLFVVQKERELIQKTSDDIISNVLSSNRPMSYEQILSEVKDVRIFSKAKDVTDDMVLTALNDLLDKQYIISWSVDACSHSGKQYVVRVYNHSGFGVSDIGKPCANDQNNR